MLTSDTIFDEIRESRRRMSKECAHDPAKYVEYLRTFDQKYAAQIERYRREHSILVAKAESMR